MVVDRTDHSITQDIVFIFTLTSMANPTKDNLYGYDANKILPIIAAVIIGISLIGHYVQNRHATRISLTRTTY
jgi:hypothetical protein